MTMDIKPKNTKPNPKPEDVKIVSFQPVALPVATMQGQGFNVMIWGLGDDGNMYQWDGRRHCWAES